VLASQILHDQQAALQAVAAQRLRPAQAATA
jgi:hypothetical protein